MDNQYISIEQLAAYLDGNLSEAEADSVEAALASSPALEELVAMSDQVDEDVAQSIGDGTAYDAEYENLAYDDFDLPDLDAPDGGMDGGDDVVIVYADDPTPQPDGDPTPDSDDDTSTTPDGPYHADDTFASDAGGYTWGDDMF